MRPPSPASPTTKPSHQARTPDNTMKNTSLGVWGAAMSGPRKNVAAVPPPEGVRGAGRSAPRERRRGEAPSTAPANSAYNHSMLALLRCGSRKKPARLSGLPLRAVHGGAWAIQQPKLSKKTPTKVTRACDLQGAGVSMTAR